MIFKQTTSCQGCSPHIGVNTLQRLHCCMYCRTLCCCWLLWSHIARSFRPERHLLRWPQHSLCAIPAVDQYSWKISTGNALAWIRSFLHRCCQQDAYSRQLLTLTVLLLQDSFLSTLFLLYGLVSYSYTDDTQVLQPRLHPGQTPLLRVWTWQTAGPARSLLAFLVVVLCRARSTASCRRSSWASCCSSWSEMQMICIWSSWCHCHLVISCSKSKMVYLSGVGLPRLSWKKGPRAGSGAISK